MPWKVPIDEAEESISSQEDRTVDLTQRSKKKQKQFILS